MSLIDLLYLEDNQADTVIAAVHRWCKTHSRVMDSAEAREVMAIAVHLMKSGGGVDDDILAALHREAKSVNGSANRSRVLIVEDEPLIAMDIESTLADASCTSRICFSCAEAEMWLQTNSPEFAILDIALKDGPSGKVAALLSSRGIPFIVCSAAEPSSASEVFLTGRWLQKPHDPKKLAGLVEALRQQDAHHMGRSEGNDHGEGKTSPQGGFTPGRL